jgi:hypothetical protein
MCLVKAGTVSTLTDGSRAVSPIEDPPLHISAMASASAFSVDAFMDNSMRYFPRFAQLGIALVAVYLLLAAALLGTGVSDRLTSPFLGNPAVLTIFFVAGITLVNLLYLLMQIVIVVDDCGVTAAAWRTLAFLRVDLRRVSQVFGVMLVLEIFCHRRVAAGARRARPHILRAVSRSRGSTGPVAGVAVPERDVSVSRPHRRRHLPDAVPDVWQSRGTRRASNRD